MSCKTETCPFKANRPLIVSWIVSLALSIVFSALPFVFALALDKSSLPLALFMAWYSLFPPLVILLVSLWIVAGKAPWLRASGAIWIGVSIWFLLQYLLSALAGLSVFVRLFALPAIFAGPAIPFLIAGLVLLAAGILLYIFGKRFAAPKAKPALAWTALSLLVVITFVLVPVFIAVTSNPPIKSLSADILPTRDQVFGYVSEVYNLGERRPGSEIDHKAIDFLEAKLRGFGYTDVRVEKSNFDYWEPVKWSIEVQPGTPSAWQPETFYVPYSGPTPAEGISADVVYIGNISSPDWQDVKGKIVLVDIPPTDVSWDQMKLFSYMAYEPEHMLKGWAHPYPIGWMMKYSSFYDKVESRQPAGIIGILRGYPDMGNFTYYAPYEGILRPIPSMYLKAEAGDKLKTQVAAGKTTLKLVLDAKVAIKGGESANVYAMLPGQSDKIIIFHSHHDSPWRSGVEDSSGTGMVLGLAKYYSQVPLADRPYTMMFLFTGGHMVGAATDKDFVERHKADILPKAMDDIAIEHIADDYLPPAAPTGNAEPRGVFITENPVTVALFSKSIVTAGLSRTLVFPTGTPLGVPTDAQDFGRAGIPVVSLISGPAWLFDEHDTLERVDSARLAPLSAMYINFASRLGATPECLLRFNLTWSVLGLLIVMSALAALFLAYRKQN